MASPLRSLATSFLFVSFPIQLKSEVFEFSEFSPSDSISYRGNAKITNNKIQLTPAVPENRSGSAWIDKKLNFGIGFDLTFSFTVGGGQNCCGFPEDPNGGDGFAVVIHNDPRGLSAIGASGGNLGSGDIHSAVIIEFDTFSNDRASRGGDAGDPAANHVAVLSNGIRLASTNHHTSLFSSSIWNSPFSFEDQSSHVARLVYRPGQLNIYVGSSVLPTNPVLSIPINLATVDNFGILDSESEAYIGFTASTGGATNNHIINEFSLTTLEEFVSVIPVPKQVSPAVCVKWMSEAGVLYQVQYSTDMSNWTSIDKVFKGNGEAMTYFEKEREVSTFFRVVRSTPE